MNSNLSLGKKHFETLALSAKPQKDISILPKPDLKCVRDYAASIEKQNNVKGGMPTLIIAMCDVEASTRYYSEK